MCRQVFCTSITYRGPALVNIQNKLTDITGLPSLTANKDQITHNTSDPEIKLHSSCAGVDKQKFA